MSNTSVCPKCGRIGKLDTIAGHVMWFVCAIGHKWQVKS